MRWLSLFREDSLTLSGFVIEGSVAQPPCEVVFVTVRTRDDMESIPQEFGSDQNAGRDRSPVQRGNLRPQLWPPRLFALSILQEISLD